MGRGCQRVAWTLAAVTVLLAVAVLAAAYFAGRGTVAPTAPEAELETAAGPPPPRRAPEPEAGRDPRPVDGWVLHQARTFMENPREDACGPYRLETDLDPQAGEAWIEICRQLAASLDQVFQERFAVTPRGEPRETVLLFRARDAFRSFGRESGRLRAGYAAFADGSRGFVALPIGTDGPTFARTLAHELGHLVLRRSLGPGLPPWLSEGLADAVGDPATEEGLGVLQGLRGVEPQARRLREAYRRPEISLGLERLASLDRSSFDQGNPTYDYEQSALFVRYLLLQPALAPRFRLYLQRLAAGTPARPGLLPETLGRSWRQLDDGLRSWLDSQPSGP